MIVTVSFFIFIFIYCFLSNKDKHLFKTSGWLYFISHYQFFMLGICLMFVCFSSPIIGFMYSFFFYNSFFLFLNLILFLFLIPFSLDFISYGLFDNSFFLEKFLYKKKNLLGKNRSSFYNFCNLYVRICYFLFACLFFIFALTFLFLTQVFVLWAVINQKNFCYIINFLVQTNLGILGVLIVFLIPCMFEMFNYGLYNRSFFCKFSDY